MHASARATNTAVYSCDRLFHYRLLTRRSSLFRYWGGLVSFWRRGFFLFVISKLLRPGIADEMTQLRRGKGGKL
jgi:hypothetical protein